MKIKKYTNNDAPLWDGFMQSCPMATFLHSRRFLSYHGERFTDESLIIYDDEDKLIALLPAAVSPNNSTEIISHPGATYGGILTLPRIRITTQLDIFEKMLAYYRDAGFQKLLYKAVPDCFKTLSLQDDLYCLFYFGAKLVRRDLNCVIFLQKPSLLTSSDQSDTRRRKRIAEENGLKISQDRQYLAVFWQGLEDNLIARHQVKPVHSLEEISYLQSIFSDNIKCIFVLKEGQVIAGAVLFLSGKTVHTQYLYVGEAGRKIYALDYLVGYCIQFARENAMDYFSFGISTENKGEIFNANLYLSKAKHGGVGMVHDVYQINL